MMQPTAHSEKLLQYFPSSKIADRKKTLQSLLHTAIAYNPERLLQNESPSSPLHPDYIALQKKLRESEKEEQRLLQKRKNYLAYQSYLEKKYRIQKH